MHHVPMTYSALPKAIKEKIATIGHQTRGLDRKLHHMEIGQFH